MLKIKGKRVLITGGAGFIGSHLVDRLLQSEVGHIAVVYQGSSENLSHVQNSIKLYHDDARDFGSMNTILKQEKIDIVYNLATIPLNNSFFNPYTTYRINVDLTDTALRLLKENAYGTLIHISSSDVYGTAIYTPIDEDHPVKPTTPYAAGKAAADLMIQSFYNIEPLDISIIRLFSNYGPRQNMFGQTAGIIPATIRRIMNNENPTIEGDGSQIRDYCYVEDTSRGLILAYENEESRRRVINLGTGVELTIQEIIDEICKYFGYNGDIDRLPERKANVKKSCASTRQAKDILGFTPEFAFDKGIKKTIDWYISRGYG